MNSALAQEEEKPRFLTPKPENIPPELQALPCAVWKGEPRPGGGFSKRPMHPRGFPLSVNKPEQWTGFAECLPAVKTGGFDGFGVLLTGEADANGDYLLGGDIDHADTTLRENPELARAIMGYRKSGGRVEHSPSGTGVRVFWRGTTPDPGRKCGGVEIYRGGRFLTVTGHGQGAILADPKLTAAFLKAINGGQPAPQAGPTKGAAVLPFPTAAKPSTAQLDRIEDRVREQAGTVWDGQWERWSNDLGSGGFSDRSDADFHVCAVIARLALDTGIDPAHLAETIEEVFGRSALAERDKWQGRADYRDRTIGNAIKAVAKEWAPREQGGEASQGGGEEETTPAAGATTRQDDIRRGDILAGELFARDHADVVRYCEERRKFYRWDGVRWAPASGGDIAELGKTTAGRILDTATAMMKLDPEKGGKAIRYAMRYHTTQGLDAMLSMARTQPGLRVKASDLDADPDILGVRNGYVDLKTGTLHPGDPKKHITRTCNVDYDPEATCPQWLQALAEIFEGDQDIIDLLRVAFGYSATGYNNEEVMFIHVGHGANGKSVIANMVQWVLGDYVNIAPPSLLTYRPNDTGARNDVAALSGARMVSINELQGGDRLDEQIVKLLAGREKISARFLYREHEEFLPTATPHARTNHRPIVTGTDEGIWRRLNLIPYRRTFTEGEQDPHLEQRLRAEGAGILRWIVEGAVQWYREGLRIPAVIRQESHGYRTESDVLGRFLEDTTRADPMGRIKADDLWTRWMGYCKVDGMHPGTKTSFTRRLSERGHLTLKSNGARFYGGLTHLTGG